MIGVLITTHGKLGTELLRAAEMILGNVKAVIPVCVDQTRDIDDVKKEISTAIRKLDQGQGVLILTDLFGGTPSNISLSFLKEGEVEVVTGVNLPMLMKLTANRGNMTLKEFAAQVRDYGIKNISVATEKLSKKPEA